MSGGDKNMSSIEDYYSDEDALMSIDPDASEPNQSSYADNPEQYYSEEDQMCIDPGAAQNSSNMSEFPYSGGQCSWDYSGELSSSEASFYSEADEGAMMSGGGSYLCEYPVDPHVVLDTEEDSISGLPILQLSCRTEKGETSHEQMTLHPGDKGYIYWQTLNATNVMLNGAEVEPNGYIEVSYNQHHGGSYWPYEVVVWNGTMENAISSYINVHMIVDVKYETKVDFFKPSIPLIEIPKTTKYIQGSLTLSAKFTGKLTSFKGDTPMTVGYSMEKVYMELSKEIEFGDIKFKPTFTFEKPIELNPAKGKIEVDLGLSGDMEVEQKFKVGDQNCTLKGKIGFNALKASKDYPNGSWELGIFEISISGEAVCKLWEFDLPNIGTLSGTLTYKLEGTVQPKWADILKEFVKRYGQTLLTRSYAAANFVAGVVTSPAFIAAAGAATIVVSATKWLQALDLKYHTDVILPKYSAALKRGVDDGANGRKSIIGSIAIADEDTAYQAGVAAGSYIRKALEFNGESFDTRTAAEKAEIIQSITSSSLAKMKLELWKSKAASLKDVAWYESDHEHLRDQQYWWYVMIGGKSPREYGGNYLNAWITYRVDTEYSRGLSWYGGSW